MTINKSQGLKCCGLHLPCSVFTHGQLYVAASRVADPENVRIFANQREFCSKVKQRDNISAAALKQYTRNRVYPEVLD